MRFYPFCYLLITGMIRFNFFFRKLE